jgi:hypothetical protein
VCHLNSYVFPIPAVFPTLAFQTGPKVGIYCHIIVVVVILGNSGKAQYLHVW